MKAVTADLWPDLLALVVGAALVTLVSLLAVLALLLLVDNVIL